MKPRRAFTLLELLVVIAIIAMLMGILLPSLNAAKGLSRSAVCQSNIRQLCVANSGYASEYNGYYVPASEGMMAANPIERNLKRWHGVRDSLDEAFDPRRGPLVRYLEDGSVRECPEKVRFHQGTTWDESFEKGCGGYGYNQAYIGSRSWQPSLDAEQIYALTARDSEVRRPAETLMFADCALVRQSGGQTVLIEYSFAEPPYIMYYGQEIQSTTASLHFRHRDKADVAWVDGHVSVRNMADLEGSDIYGVKSARLGLGWFDPPDNSLFDLR